MSIRRSPLHKKKKRQDKIWYKTTINMVTNLIISINTNILQHQPPQRQSSFAAITKEKKLYTYPTQLDISQKTFPHYTWNTTRENILWFQLGLRWIWWLKNYKRINWTCLGTKISRISFLALLHPAPLPTIIIN